ncbi:Glycosyltransferase involved in cell wall bisynthesis [Clostridium sp. USBA 49]|jgi:glycosyltransferase involved in cell wall biosynthesis|uniref:glycosyltransferase n=1 Tax=Clostridium TaxID=1485 RepID=UPI00099ADC74|nr:MULTISPECIES: glycosyltransferase [Clostridium]SKA88204.1 Glycosyltransferase involved in cell wall bisynthesis [Clostridium sp. USBA 49]
MNNKQLHILIIPSWYPTKDMPLSGIFFKEQAQALTKEGIKVGLIYPETRWLSKFKLKHIKDYHFQIKQNYEENVNVFREYSWNIFPKTKKMQSKQWIYEAEKLYKNYVKKYGKPDIIHAHSVLWAGYTAMKLSKKFKVPYIITEHSSSFAKNLIKSWQIPYINEAFDNAEKIIAVSSPFAKLLSSYSKNSKIDVIPNMVDTEYFYFKEKKKKEKFIFLFTAFLTPKKGADVLIKSFAVAFKGNKDVILRIGGDGEQKQELIELVNKLGINSQVEFLGMLKREEVRKNLWEANIFVLPSYYETFGVVLIEALATGTPVISTKCGGPEDIVKEGLGKLVESGNIEALSKELENSYYNYNNYDFSLIRKYAVENYSSHSISNKLINSYKEILNIY